MLVGGVSVDRFSPRRVMLASNALRAFYNRGSRDLSLFGAVNWRGIPGLTLGGADAGNYTLSTTSATTSGRTT